MNFPQLRPGATKILDLPDLSGGINLRDSVNKIRDNQLTDCINVWNYNGLLTNRPGTASKLLFATPKAAGSKKETVKESIIKKHDIFKSGNQLCSILYKNEQSQSIAISFLWIDQNGVSTTNKIPNLNVPKELETYFIADKSGELYLFGSNQKVYKFKDKWVELKNSDFYIPLAVAHCKSTGHTKGNDGMHGTMVEGFNILSDYYKLTYSTVNRELLSDTKKTHKMIYYLLRTTNKDSCIGKTVKAVIIDENGNEVTHTVTLKKGSSDKMVNATESKAQSDGLKMQVSYSNVKFLKSDGTVATVEEDDFIEDNLTITAPYPSSATEKKKVFSQTNCQWFGGYSAGIYGGTRLFLCGNTYSKNKNLVVWSGLNDPTYFPENGFFKVGGSSESVTAMAKQGEMLVLFKPNEMWYSLYNYNESIEATDLITQSVVDYTSSSVYFTLTMINPFIGCSHKDSVQLCRNRLVWLGADNKIYTLVSNNQYSERNVFCVSEMIDKRLAEEKAENVQSADWNGNYLLKINDHIYIMDYNCYGYSHISSYSKSEDANQLIPWFYWELPINKNSLIFMTNSNIFFVENSSGNINKVCFDMDSGFDKFSNDEKIPITCLIQTKLLEFAAPHIRKIVESVNLQMIRKDGGDVYINFITEAGENEEIFSLKDSTFINSKMVFPNIKNVLRFGIKLICKGSMSIDSIILKYRFTGGSR